MDQCGAGCNEKGTGKVHGKPEVLKIAFFDRIWMCKECAMQKIFHVILP